MYTFLTAHNSNVIKIQNKLKYLKKFNIIIIIILFNNYYFI